VFLVSLGGPFLVLEAALARSAPFAMSLTGTEIATGAGVALAYLVLCVFTGMLCSTFFTKVTTAMLAAYLAVLGFVLFSFSMVYWFQGMLELLTFMRGEALSGTALLGTFLVGSVVLSLVSFIFLMHRVRHLMQPL